jgi:hypothetical protein
MKRTLTILATIIFILSVTAPVAASGPVSWSSWPSTGYPYFFIESVVKDQTVTIRAYNFPANDTFNVTMGYYGSYGIGGFAAGTTSSGSGGSFVATYTIPAALAGQSKIAIRLQSPTSGYFAYNWFFNNTFPGGTGGQPEPPKPGYNCCPYFFIKAVERDKSVTITAYNFPANDTFTVTMGPYGGYGVGGFVVGTTKTDADGGAFEATYTIPATLAGSYLIAIRLESYTTGYFAYNWFYNNTTGGTGGQPEPPDSGYKCCPYFFITAVVKDQSVTIDAKNFGPNDSYIVTMGPYGSYGLGGYVVATTTTDASGNFKATYTIPAAMAGSSIIAIRLQSPATGYFGYNWFYNNNAP